MIQLPLSGRSYRDWIDLYPEGYVINVRRDLSPEYMVLHRADCRSLANAAHDPAAFVERQYRKVCSTELSELRAWAVEKGRSDGTFSAHCQLCHPLAERFARRM